MKVNLKQLDSVVQVDPNTDEGDALIAQKLSLMGDSVPEAVWVNAPAINLSGEFLPPTMLADYQYMCSKNN